MVRPKRSAYNSFVGFVEANAKSTSEGCGNGPMPLCVVLIIGPRRSGKTTLSRLMAREVMKRPPHLLRLVRSEQDDPDERVVSDEFCDPAIASTATMHYSPARIFESLPHALKEVRGQERVCTIVVEGDGYPCLRNAYPYHHRLFVTYPPTTLESVFRTRAEANVALQEVLNDTAAFASEIFGLLEAGALDDEEPKAKSRSPHLSVAMHRFLSSPLGVEIASRIQLQPGYQGLPESDIVLVNTGVGSDTPVGDECIRRLDLLMSRIRQDAGRHRLLFCCDPLDPHDPARGKLLARLATLCTQRT